MDTYLKEQVNKNKVWNSHRYLIQIQIKTKNKEKKQTTGLDIRALPNWATRAFARGGIWTHDHAFIRGNLERLGCWSCLVDYLLIWEQVDIRFDGES